MITGEDKERVRQATDFLQLVSETVELRRRGADWWGCCPFHHEKSPSFHVNPATGLFKCFGCGEGGDVFDYVMKRESLEFPDAIRFLADRAGIELVEERGARKGPGRKRLLECLDEAESYYVTILNRGRGAGPAQGRAYLAGRGFGSEVCRRWGLGYAPGHRMLYAHLGRRGFTDEEMEQADLVVRRNGRMEDRFFDRVMFPIHDEQGRTLAFGGRVLGEGKPKYLNTKETAVFHKGRHLFAFDKAKEHIATRGEAIVCEGYTDVMALHEAGYPIAVAALGTSFSLDHVRTLARFAKRIVCMFDGDAAGQRAAERAIQFLDKSEADLRCVVLPDNQDPAEFLDTHRASDLDPILQGAEPLMDFVLAKRLEGLDPTAPAGVRAAKLDELAGVLAPLKSSVVLDGYVLEVASRLGVSPEAVRRAVQAKPVSQATSPFQSGARDARPQGSRYPPSSQGVSHRGAAPSVAYDEQEAYVPDDYLPLEAMSARQADVPVGVGVSPDERMQIQAERELLALMATDVDELRPHAERIATLSWASEQHEAMAWAMLATPLGSTPAEVVQAATMVVEDAPRILASGRVASSVGLDERVKVTFVLDTVELYSTRRRIRVLRSRLRAGEDPSSGLFADAARLQRHANDLALRLSQLSAGQTK